MKNLLLFIVTVLLSTTSCNQEQSKESEIFAEIEAKASKAKDPCSRLDILDAEMQLLIKKIIQKYKDEEFFEKRFRMSQVYWIQYRDRHLKALYPKDWNTYYRKEYTKEIFNQCKCLEHTRLTSNRIKELALFFEESEVKGDCPSIWNIKK